MFSIFKETDKQIKHRKALDLLDNNVKVAKTLKEKINESVDAAVDEFKKEYRGRK